MAAKSKKQKSAKQGKKQAKGKKGKQQEKPGKGKKAKRKQPIEIVDEAGSVSAGSMGLAPALSKKGADGGKGASGSVRMKSAVEQAPVDVAQSVEIKSRAFEYAPVPEDAAEPSARSSKYTDIEPIDAPVVSDEDVVALEEVIAHLEAVRATDEMSPPTEAVAGIASTPEAGVAVGVPADDGAAAPDPPASASRVPDATISGEATEVNAGLAMAEEHAEPAGSVEAAGSGEGDGRAGAVVAEADISADGAVGESHEMAPETVVEMPPADVPVQPDGAKRTAPGQTAELPKVPEAEEGSGQKPGRGQALVATFCAVALVLLVFFLILVRMR